MYEPTATLLSKPDGASSRRPARAQSGARTERKMGHPSLSRKGVVGRPPRSGSSRRDLWKPVGRGNLGLIRSRMLSGERSQTAVRQSLA